MYDPATIPVFDSVVTKEPVPEPVTSPVSVMVWSQVFAPERFDAVIVPVNVFCPSIVSFPVLCTTLASKALSETCAWSLPIADRTVSVAETTAEETVESPDSTVASTRDSVKYLFTAHSDTESVLHGDGDISTYTEPDHR